MPDLPHGIRRGVSLLRTIVSKNTTNCEMCGEEFAPISAKHRFCSDDCRAQWWRAARVKRKCLTCGANYMGRRGQKYCTLQCTPAQAIKWKDNEVIYLASINAGYGFRRFVRKLYLSGDELKQQFRFSGIFEEIKEETGVDLYAILQDPSKMEKVTGRRLYRTTRAYPDRTEEFAWAITASAREHGRKRKTDKHLNFNWGTFADDPRAEHEGSE